MIKYRYYILFICCLTISACGQQNQDNVPTIGFIEAFEDATIAQARKGFMQALEERNFSEQKGTLRVIAKNAQGDIPTLNQIVQYYVSEEVDLIGTSTTLATISAVQRNRDIPVFMSVSSMPQLIGLEDENGQVPSNLFGVGENLNYIDTSFSIITKMVKPRTDHRRIKVGMIYNQSEPQSVDAYNRIARVARAMHVEVVALPLNTSAEAQLVTRALLDQDIDAFFANPDNTVFAAFETILKNCNTHGVPIFTSEAGLVQRGAVAAYGADIYQWGYQAGVQAADYLTSASDSLAIELVDIRKSVYNPAAAARFGFVFPDTFEEVAIKN